MPTTRATWVRVVMVLACLFGAALMIPGVQFAWAIHTYGIHDWQEVSVPVMLFLFFPSALAGWKYPKISAVLFVVIAAISVTQVLGITPSTGDGLAAGVVGMAFIVGIPALRCALLFRKQSRTL